MFMILALGALGFAIMFTTPLLQENSNDQLAEMLTTIVLVLPILLSYASFFIFNFIEFCLCISLIKNDSKGLGIVNLILCIVGAAVAAFFIIGLLN